MALPRAMPLGTMETIIIFTLLYGSAFFSGLKPGNIILGALFTLFTELVNFSSLGLRTSEFLWFLAPAHPGMYIMANFLAIIVHKKREDGKFNEHSTPDAIVDWFAGLVRPTLELYYTGPVDHSQPPMDELSVMKDAEQVIDWLNTTNNVKRHAVYFISGVIALLASGLPGLVLTLMMIFLFELQRNTMSGNDVKLYTSKAMPKKDGIYKIGYQIFGKHMYLGVGYMEEGTFYTRYHVTKGAYIETGEDQRMWPCYVNPTQDNVAYGNPPKWHAVKDGEEVTVFLSGPYSNRTLVYRTHITMLDSGKLVFRGCKSIPGCSGSPIFKDVEVEVTDETGETRTILSKKFIGSVGWSATLHLPGDHIGKTAAEVVGLERATPDIDVPIIPGTVTQVFMKPGAGKTRTLIPNLTHRGLNKFGRVYITGPTKVVCREIYEALSEQFEGKVSFMTSDASKSEKGSFARPIHVMAHATALSMLLRNASGVTYKGLWVIDEAHFMNTKSLILKDFLRHHTQSKKKGAMVEMTATGFNIRSKKIEIKTGSNYHIQDHTVNDDGILAKIYSEESADKKNIVFVTSIDGRESTSSKRISQKLRSMGRACVELNRKTFDINYKIAKEMSQGYILTTDISECGANYLADDVYDFQVSTKPVMAGRHVAYERVTIDSGQRVQRRGRVGRLKPGNYYSPNLDTRANDLNRVEHHDRAVFAESYGISIEEPCVGATCKLTMEQIQSWIDINEQSIESPWTVELMLDSFGVAKEGKYLQESVRDWLDNERVDIKVRGVDISCSFWDERDKKKLEYVLAAHGQINIHDKESYWLKHFHNYLKEIRKSVRGAIIPPALEENPNEEDDEQAMDIRDPDPPPPQHKLL